MPELPKITINHLKICVRNINGLNPDDIVDLLSHIEKYDLAIFCEAWLKETIDYTIKWRNYMQVLLVWYYILELEKDWIFGITKLSE